MVLVEVGPKSDELKRAERVVASWLTFVWSARPTWVNRMPDAEDCRQLINMIAEELEKKTGD